jgi:hypothetical protein
MTISKKTKKAGAIVGTLTVFLVILGLFLPGLLEPTVADVIYPDEHLFVDETILLKTDETNDSVSVTCILHITNEWEKESGEIKAIAYVVETKNNFAISETEVEIGEIKADSTAKIDIPMELSNNSYKVKVLLFENDKLVIRGELLIRAYPVYSWEEIKRGEVEEQEWYVLNTATDFYQIR